MANDTAVCICNNCMAMIGEDAGSGALENVWVLIDGDPSFPLPRYEGKRMGVQDCGRVYGRADVQDAVRSLLEKMGIEVVELPDARGKSFLKQVPAQDVEFAPKRYGEDAKKRGIFMPMEPDSIQQKMEEHAAAISTDEVCCYCFACDMGLEAGGKDAVNMIELVSGRFRS